MAKTLTPGFTIRKGVIRTTNPRARLGSQTVKAQRVGRTVVFSGPVDLLPKTVVAKVEATL